MPNVNPYKIGDDIYEQYSLTKKIPISAGLNVLKGVIYTLNSSGYLVAVPAAAAEEADLSKGAFQAKDNVDNTAGANGDLSVECLVLGAWIILQAPAGLVIGQMVSLAVAVSVVDPDKTEGAITRDRGYLGRIYEILTKNTDSTNKIVTADNDLIVIQSGVA